MSYYALFLADGFEEVEALGTLDLMRRAGMDVRLVSIYDDRLNVTGAHKVTVVADMSLQEVKAADLSGLILPGGLPGVTNLEAEPRVEALVKEVAQSGRLVAAICAAPSLLGKYGLLSGKRATVYPGWDKHLTGATYERLPYVEDGNILTGQGMGFTMPFARRIIEKELGEEKAAEVMEACLILTGIMYTY